MLPPQTILAECVTRGYRNDSVFSVAPYRSDVLMAGTRIHEVHPSGSEGQEPCTQAMLGCPGRACVAQQQSLRRIRAAACSDALIRASPRFAETVGKKVLALGVHPGNGTRIQNP